MTLEEDVRAAGLHMDSAKVLRPTARVTVQTAYLCYMEYLCNNT